MKVKVNKVSPVQKNGDDQNINTSVNSSTTTLKKTFSRPSSNLR